MDFFIKPRGKSYVVEDSSGSRHSGPLSFEAAQKKWDTLDAAERERLTNDPVAKRNRGLKAVYRRANGNPWLQALLMPKGTKTKIRRIAEQTNKGMQASVEYFDQYRKYHELNPQGLSFSAWEHSREQQERKQRTAIAAEAHKKMGDATRKKVLALTRAKMSQKDIAEKLDIDVRTVRTHQKADKSSARIFPLKR